MTTPALDDDEMTELVDADFPRVDLVGKGANGIPRFLIAKQDEDSRGLIPPDVVRDLIGKQADDPEPTIAEQVTMTGTPGAIAAFIHKAAKGGDVAKAEMSSKAINDLPDSAFGYIEPGGTKDADGKTTPRSLRHFPIQDKAHADNAAARIAQGAKFGDKAKSKVEAAQRKFGETVSKEEAPVTETITKDAGPDLDDGQDGMDPTVPLAAPDDMGPGDPTDPGSPAWESIDAATAQKWTSIAVRLNNALSIMAEREMLEVATGSGDDDDAEAAFDLQDAQCAMDYVIDTLAGFAVGEQAEAELGGEAMESIGKALAGFDPAPLDVIEGFAGIRKAGRVLSSANESLIRTAGESLQKVLQSLPSAPVADDQVTKSKEAAVPADQTETPAAEAEVAKAEEAGEAKEAAGVVAKGLQVVAYDKAGEPCSVSPEKITKAAPGQILICGQDGGVLGMVRPGQVFKADAAEGKTAQVAVYDADGNLVGVTDPADITPLSNVKAPPKNDTAGADPDGGDATDDDDATDDAVPAAPDAAAPADPASMTPAPAADAGTAADGTPAKDDVAKAAESTTTDEREVLKSIVAEAVAAALDARAPAEDIAKAGVAAVSEEVEALKARLATVEEQDATPKVFTNGATPPAHMMRGQDRPGGQAPPVDVAKALERKKELYTADAPEQNRIAKEMQGDAIAALAAIHRR